MENQLLKDPLIKPDDKVLESTLGKKYTLFKEFETKVNEKGLFLEWNYYNDGKSWLCKVLQKKKNLAWLSIWNTGFKLTFLFTEKNIGNVHELEVAEEILKVAEKQKPVGKFIPIIMLIKNKKILGYTLKLLDCR